MNEDPRAFHMPQKLMSQAVAFMGSVDQSWDIRHDERLVQIDLNSSQVRRFGRERVVGDFRTSMGKSTQQRALASIWAADKSYVGDHFELQDQTTCFAFLTRREVARRSIR